ncbi:MAG: hypothetical protein WA913_15820, partial [Pricia sp.]
MKYITFGVCFLVMALTASCQNVPSYEKIDSANIDDSRLQFAKELSQKLLKNQKSGSPYALNASEATEEMIKGLTPKLQKKAYSKVSRQFGEYQSMTFHQMLKSKEAPHYAVYQFKGVFGEDESILEVR